MRLVDLSFIDILAIAGIVLGLLSLAATIIIPYLVRKRPAVPCYSRWSRRVIDLDPAEVGILQLSYKGQSIEQLQATRIALWNGGSDPLRQDAVVAKLRIECRYSGRILDAWLVAQSLKENSFRIEGNGQETQQRLLDFRYLSPGHFAVVDVLHTGRASELALVGALEGAEAGFSELRPGRREAIVMLVGGLLAGTVAVIGAVPSALDWNPSSTILAVVATAAVSWWACRRVSQLPRGLFPYSHAALIAMRKL